MGCGFAAAVAGGSCRQQMPAAETGGRRVGCVSIGFQARFDLGSR